MKAIMLALVFGIVGLVGSYMIFGTIRGHYINPEVMIESITGHSTVGRYISDRTLGIKERAIKIAISTGFAGFLGFIVGLMMRGNNPQGGGTFTPTTSNEALDFIVARDQRTRKINNWIRVFAVIALIVLLFFIWCI